MHIFLTFSAKEKHTKFQSNHIWKIWIWMKGIWLSCTRSTQITTSDTHMGSTFVWPKRTFWLNLSQAPQPPTPLSTLALSSGINIRGHWSPKTWTYQLSYEIFKSQLFIFIANLTLPKTKIMDFSHMLHLTACFHFSDNMITQTCPQMFKIVRINVDHKIV